MATQKQAWALYRRFFPESRFADVVVKAEADDKTNHNEPLLNDSNHSHSASRLSELANQFAESVPADEFSTAELQGYLLMCKMKPVEAVSGIAEWIEQERAEKREREEREEKRKEKLRESRLKAKTAMVAELVGPLQRHTASGDTSSSSSTLSGPSSNPVHDPVTPQTTHLVNAQLENQPGAVKSLKINGVNTLDS